MSTRRDRRRTGTTPQGRGRFLGFDVLAQVPTWDRATAGVVLSRLGPHEELRFFTPAEHSTAAALFDRLLDQDDEPRVPIVHLVDERLALNRTDGYRYTDMPEDRAAWHLTLAALDADAAAAYGCSFADCPVAGQEALVQAVSDVIPGRWHDLPAKRVWSLWTRYAATAFYSHPWAWNEIGFGGPAYPRGYQNLGLDAREHWEKAEQNPANPAPVVESTREARHRKTEAVLRRAPKHPVTDLSPEPHPAAVDSARRDAAAHAGRKR